MTRPSVALDTSSGPVASRPLASWYAEGASDGLGDRLLMFDNSETPSLELLRFRPELASTPGFESALRERVAELEGFAHPGFPQIRAIQQLDAGGLALVSTSTAGKRLAEVFRAPRVRGGAHPAFAAWLVRDLTAALADLQRHGAGIAHGALTPDRVVLTPDGRLVITEHVLATALDRLRFPVTRLWRDLGIVAISNGGAASRLDCRTDVIQLGWIVLSVLLGRRVAPVEYPSHIEELFDEFVRNSRSRSPSLVPALRRWLERALQLDNQAFESAIDAQDALYELRVHGGPHAIFVGRRHATEQISYSIPPQLAPMPESLLEPEPEPEAPHVEAAVDVEPDLALTESSDSEISHMGVATDFIDEGRGRSVEHQFDHLEPDTFRHAAARRIKLAWSVAAMLAFVAGIEGAVIGSMPVEAIAAETEEQRIRLRPALRRS
jgi:serine/threonine protein kinase